jgi:hypothetical protein
MISVFILIGLIGLLLIVFAMWAAEQKKGK